ARDHGSEGATMKPVRVAAAQLAPVFMDTAATLAKAADAVREAARNGAELVVFPEAFVPGSPFWAMTLDPMSINPFVQRLYAEAVQIPAPGASSAVLAGICAAARESHIAVCLGISERSGGTLFNSQLFLGSDGAIVGCRRKLMPTSHERMVWGRGDGSDLRIFEFPFGRVGGLICYEHANPLFRYALIGQGEEIHIATWPGLGGISTIVDAACRHHAFEAQAFVVSVTSVMTAATLEALGTGGSSAKLQVGGGYTAILTPRGDFLAGPQREGEAILYADLDPALIDKAKSIVDSVGHYARPDVVRLHLDRTAQRSLVDD
ncbi:MAG TPA: carbon-nitrogen hydrolase family protein, partial [Polyangia bacterium]